MESTITMTITEALSILMFKEAINVEQFAKKIRYTEGGVSRFMRKNEKEKRITRRFRISFLTAYGYRLEELPEKMQDWLDSRESF